MVVTSCYKVVLPCHQVVISIWDSILPDDVHTQHSSLLMTVCSVEHYCTSKLLGLLYEVSSEALN